MKLKKISSLVVAATLVATTFCLPAPAAAQSGDDQLAALADCLHTCQLAYAGTGNTAGYNQCVASCIARYDGGFGNDGGPAPTEIPCGPTGCTPIPFPTRLPPN